MRGRFNRELKTVFPVQQKDIQDRLKMDVFDGEEP